MADLGRIGSAEVTVELDFTRAIEQARGVLSPQLVRAFEEAAAKAGGAFSETVAAETASGGAAAGKESAAAFGSTNVKGMATAGAEGGAAFGETVASETVAASAVAGRGAGRAFGATFAKGLTSTVAGVIPASFRAIAAEAAASAARAGRRAGVAFAEGFAVAMRTGLAATAAITRKALLPLVATLAGFGVVAAKSVSTVTELTKTQKLLADTYGLSAEQAGVYAAAAKELDIPQQKLALGFTTLAKNAKAATLGSDKQRKAFAQLGISQKFLRDNDLNTVFLQTIENLKNMKGGASKAATSQLLFGKGFVSLRPLIKDGADGIEHFTELAEKYHAVIKDPDAAQKFLKAQKEFKFAILGLEVQLGQKLLPTLARWATKIANVIATSKPLHQFFHGISIAVQGIVKGFQGFVTSFADAFSKASGDGSARTFSDLMISLGQTVGDLAAKWLPRLGTALGTLFGFLKEHETTAKVFFGFLVASKVIGFANALGLVIGPLKLILPLLVRGGAALALWAGPAIVAGISALGAAFVSVGAAAGPMLAAVAPIAAVVAGTAAAFALAWNNSELFRQGCQIVSDAALAMIPGLRQGLEAVSDLALSFQDLGPVTNIGDLSASTQAFAEFGKAHKDLAGSDLVKAFRAEHPEIVKSTTLTRGLTNQNGALATNTKNAKNSVAGLGASYAKELNTAGTAADKNRRKFSNTITGLKAKAVSAAQGSIISLATSFKRLGFNIGLAQLQMSSLILTLPTIHILIKGLNVLVGTLKNSILRVAQVLMKNFVDAFRFAVISAQAVLFNASFYSAGVAIMATLLQGLRAGFVEVQKFVGGIAKWIKDNKGPISADKQLLVPAGKAIMHGFNVGLQKRWAPVQDWVKNIGGFFKGAVSGASFNATIGNILLGKGSVKDLNTQLSKSLGLPPGLIGTGPLGFLHPTSGWPDTLSQGKIIERMFGVGITSGLRPGAITSSGNVSQHALGQALDFGTSRGSFSSLTKLATFASTLVNKIFKQVIWLNSLWQDGHPGFGFVSGHMDHVHLGWQPRAAGGQARRGRSYQWNERGREMFMPNTNGYIWNASNTKALVSALKTLPRGGGNSTRSIGKVEIHTQQVDARSLTQDLGRVFSRV